MVTFSIDAEEGYTGSYTITLTPAIVPKEKANVTGMLVYLALGTTFKFTIDVPNGSLGERPLAPVATPTSEIPEIAKEVAESESGIIWKEMGKSIFLDMPSKVYFGRPILVQKGIGVYTPYIAVAVLAFALLVAMLVLLRRKKRS
ncbi:MAG: hypothetical protein ACXQS5_07160 [Candidatus Methanospirareceae archaeon]